MPVEERFWAKVDKSGDCWLWTAALSQDGYGLFRLVSKQSMVGAHRVSYMLTKGPIPEGMQVDHYECYNPACVRPSHLRLATNKKNVENRKGATRDSKSGIRGVCWHKATSKWIAKVGHNSRTHYVGVFDRIEDAEAAVIAKRKELYGEEEEVA